MVTFILIFFLMVIAASISAVVLFSIYLKRRNKSLNTTNQKQLDEPPPYRSLFESDEAELRADERTTQMRAESERREAQNKIAFEKSEKLREFEKIWRDAPTRQNTVEWLRRAAENGSAEIFSQTAETVVRVWRGGEVKNLSNEDLADLLDSHLRILPQQERLSGAIFWIRREIENLRGKSES